MLDVKVSLGPPPSSCYEGLPASCYGNRPVAVTVLGSVQVTGSLGFWNDFATAGSPEPFTYRLLACTTLQQQAAGSLLTVSSACVVQ